ncbi:MAG: amidohydrolase [Bacteroidales bacterium]|nr:amidohydrolase [Bacteroidales bacterium]
MNSIKISALQTNIVWENPEENVKNIRNLVFLNPGADLYVLPEMFNTGFTDNVELFGENIEGKTVKELKEISRISEAAICGSIVLKENDKYYNACLFIRPDGTVDIYKKRHLFKYGGEGDMFSKGNERVVVDYLGWRIILMVCYDLRFPVWSRNCDDYDLMIYVANWPASRRYIHDILLKARAIENQSYLVSCNRVGEDGKNIRYNGGSYIIDYKGEIIVAAQDNNVEVINSELYLDELNLYRKNFPAQNDREIFKII